MADLDATMRDVRRSGESWGRAAARSMWGFVLAMHRPIGDSSACPLCHTSWPCDTTRRATDERDRLRLVPRREA